MIRIVLLGSPGSGKGTQAKVLAQHLQLEHLSTGDILRDEVKLRTELGCRAKQRMEDGRLAPDSLILDIIRGKLISLGVERGFILDGFPRTLAQAEGLDHLVEELSVQIDAVVNLKVDSETLVRRLSARSSCSTCGAIYNDVTKPPQRAALCDLDNGPLLRRTDDDEAVIRQRLNVYHQQTEPLEEYYRSRELLIQIDGDGSVEDVTARILQSLAPSKKKK